MKSNIKENKLKYYSTIPSVWGGVIGYQYATTHYEDGWRDIVEPYNFDPKLHKLGEMYYDEANDVVTYQLIEKTQQEVDEEIYRELRRKQQEALLSVSSSKVLEEIQAYDDEEALQIQHAYPLWESGVYVGVGEKRQDLGDDNELKLYRCVSAHKTKDELRPKNAGTLWIELIQDELND